MKEIMYKRNARYWCSVLNTHIDKILFHTTVGSKIIHTLEIHFVKKLMQFYEINISQVMIFWLYTVYNKHEIIKIDNQTREKSQELE